MERIPINVDKDGCSYCLVSKYYKEKAKIAKYLMGGGISSTVMENHGCALAIIEIVRYEKANKIERNH